jgi:hypothetical protein
MLRRTVIKVIALFTLLLPALVAPATAQAQQLPSSHSVVSNNWSGYILEGSYTKVVGTFRVPTLTTGVAPYGEVAEWVGVDGSGNTTLLQAGVSLSGSECDGSGMNGLSAYPGHVYYVCAWTAEVVDGAFIEGPIPTLLVRGGDTVTVTLWQQAQGLWGIQLKDQTTGADWSTFMTYNSPGTSAEWVVEDPGMPGQGCGVVVGGLLGQCPLPAFYPAVKFSGLGIYPPAPLPATVLRVSLGDSEGGIVARPSPMHSVGSDVYFTDSYVGEG